MNILITGAAGFIGLRLATALQLRGHSVTGYDNFHPQVHGDNPNKTYSFQMIEGDVRDSDKLTNVIRFCQPSIIYHLAAETGTGQSFDEPSRYIDVNVNGTAILFESLRVSSFFPKKIILASSRAVYGEGMYVDNSGTIAEANSRISTRMAAGDFSVYGNSGEKLIPKPTPESFHPKPDSVYASTKLMQELLLKNLASGIDWTILRFQNVYGPGQSLYNPYTGVLSIFCSLIKKGEKLNIFEDGKIYRDFIFIDDVVASLLNSIDKGAQGTYNIGSGIPVSIEHVVSILLANMREKGYKSNSFVSGQFRDGDIRYACADIQHAQNELSWEPSIKLDEGLQFLVDWACKE